MHIEMTNLTLRYKDFAAVDNVSLEVPNGESLVLLGQSGCGKTSTMRCIAGLEVPASGRITIGGEPVFDSERNVNTAPNKRNVGMVFQSYAVWPNKTVYENVAFPLQRQGKKSHVVKKRVHEVLELTGLQHFTSRGASMLSGGQMQRVALARSIAMGPAVLLLDEPLSNLDAQLRERLRNELRRIQQEARLTSVYVTHDQTEAMALADKIAMMQEGKIVQYGKPSEIFDTPASASIAAFMGVANIFSLAGSSARSIKVNGVSLDIQITLTDPEKYKLGIRPSDISISKPSDQPLPNTARGHVTVALFQGTYIAYEVAITEDLIFLVNADKNTERFSPGDAVDLLFTLESLQILPAK